MTSVGKGGLTVDIEGETYGPGVAALNPDLQVGDSVPVAFLHPGSSRHPVLLSHRPKLFELPAIIASGGGGGMTATSVIASVVATSIAFARLRAQSSGRWTSPEADERISQGLTADCNHLRFSTTVSGLSMETVLLGNIARTVDASAYEWTDWHSYTDNVGLVAWSADDGSYTILAVYTPIWESGSGGHAPSGLLNEYLIGGTTTPIATQTINSTEDRWFPPISGADAERRQGALYWDQTNRIYTIVTSEGIVSLRRDDLVQVKTTWDSTAYRSSERTGNVAVCGRYLMECGYTSINISTVPYHDNVERATLRIWTRDNTSLVWTPGSDLALRELVDSGTITGGKYKIWGCGFWEPRAGTGYSGYDYLLPSTRWPFLRRGEGGAWWWWMCAQTAYGDQYFYIYTLGTDESINRIAAYTPLPYTEEMYAGVVADANAVLAAAATASMAPGEPDLFEFVDPATGDLVYRRGHSYVPATTEIMGTFEQLPSLGAPLLQDGPPGTWDPAIPTSQQCPSGCIDQDDSHYVIFHESINMATGATTYAIQDGGAGAGTLYDYWVDFGQYDIIERSTGVQIIAQRLGGTPTYIQSYRTWLVITSSDGSELSRTDITIRYSWTDDGSGGDMAIADNYPDLHGVWQWARSGNVLWILRQVVWTAYSSPLPGGHTDLALREPHIEAWDVSNPGAPTLIDRHTLHPSGDLPTRDYVQCINYHKPHMIVGVQAGVPWATAFSAWCKDPYVSSEVANIASEFTCSGGLTFVADYGTVGEKNARNPIMVEALTMLNNADRAFWLDNGQDVVQWTP